MHQQPLPEVLFERYRNPTRREHFIEEMNRVVPWVDLVAVIKLVYPKAEGLGGSASSVCCLSIVYSSGSTSQIRPSKKRRMTHAPCDSSWELIWAASQCPTRRCSASFGISWKLIDGRTAIYTDRGVHKEAGPQVNEGTIVDAAIAAASSSTKNRQRARDPEMRQTKKGNQ